MGKFVNKVLIDKLLIALNMYQSILVDLSFHSVWDEHYSKLISIIIKKRVSYTCYFIFACLNPVRWLDILMCGWSRRQDGEIKTKFYHVVKNGRPIFLVSRCRTMQWFYGRGHICYGIMTGVSQMEHEVCLCVCVCVHVHTRACVVGRGN